MEKKTWCTSKRVLLSREKEGNPAIHNNMDGPWGHYAKWSKSDRKIKTLYHITYMEFKKAELIKTENRMGVSRGWRWGKWGDVGQGNYSPL